STWATGVWVTGTRFVEAASNSGTVLNTGTNIQEIIRTIKEQGKDNRFILAGYPPFLTKLIESGKEEGINWQDYKINLLTGGEGFVEGWRSYMQSILGPEALIYSAYGASDLDIAVANENSLTVRLLQMAFRYKEVRQKLFGGDRMPSFFGQWDPIRYHITERTTPEKKQELVFTITSPNVVLPKIKYCIGDEGGVISYQQFLQKLQELSKQDNLNKKLKGLIMILIDNIERKKDLDVLHIPFLFIFGRSDGTISIDGANIYPSDIQAAIYSDPEMAGSINSFLMEIKPNANMMPEFHLHIELR
ncbi:MAG: hypothetical protein WC838_05010, partial [Candidatus Margulisiibacteriota bacterium]